MKDSLIKLGIVIAAVFAPAKGMMITAGVLILVDLITGVLASRKQGVKIQSSIIRRTVSKLLVYESAIALAYLAQTYMLADIVPAASIASGVIGLVELTSCLENINIISGENVLKKVIDKLGSANKN